MNKPFCDICEKPAFERQPIPMLHVAGNAARVATVWLKQSWYTHSYSHKINTQCDLCQDCLISLLDQLRDDIRPRASQPSADATHNSPFNP